MTSALLALPFAHSSNATFVVADCTASRRVQLPVMARPSAKVSGSIVAASAEPAGRTKAAATRAAAFKCCVTSVPLLDVAGLLQVVRRNVGRILAIQGHAGVQLLHDLQLELFLNELDRLLEVRAGLLG